MSKEDGEVYEFEVDQIVKVSTFAYDEDDAKKLASESLSNWDSWEFQNTISVKKVEDQNG